MSEKEVLRGATETVDGRRRLTALSLEHCNLVRFCSYAHLTEADLWERMNAMQQTCCVD
jgi:hypothetical protein